MINTNINFDREDGEQIAESTRHTWSALEYALGLNNLPKLDELQGANESIDVRVARNLVTLLRRTRSQVGAGLEAQLAQQLGAERQSGTPGTPEGVSRSLEQDALATAESYIRVINRVIERRDIENLVAQLPASIRPTDGSTKWVQRIVVGGGSSILTTIDLQHPIWRSGSEEEIRTRLEGKTLAQAGITADRVPSHKVLSPDDIDNIFSSKREVIDPNLPIRQVSLDGTGSPIPAGMRVIIDLPGLFRAHPEWANNTQAELQANAKLPASIPFLRALTIATGQPFFLPGTGVPGAYVDAVVEQAFIENSRSANNGYGSIKHSLTTAIAARQPIDNLLKGTADNRELLLAFGALQRDPTAVAAIGNNSVTPLLNTRNRLTAENNLRTSVDILKTLRQPTRIITDIRASIALLPPPTTAAAWNVYNSQKQALEAEIENNIKVRAAVTEALASIRAIASIQGNLTGAGQMLNAHQAALPNMATLETEIIAGADIGQIANRIETVFNGTPADTNKGQLLEGSDFYTSELTQNAENIREAQKKQLKNGSEAAWAIVRRELENRGMRQDQLEKTMQYMRNQMDETPESARDIEELTNSVFPYVGENEREEGRWWGEPKGEATREWEQDKTYRSIKTLGLHRVKPNLQKYKKELFCPQCIGITFAQADTAMSRSIPMPRLIDAYFRTKYLMDLPEDDPRRLPSDSAEMVGFMRKVHKAILERAQLSFQNATDATEAELGQVGITPDMSKLERLQAAQSFLLNGESEYLSSRRGTIDKLVNRAYRPIARLTEGHERWKKRWKTTGKVLIADRAKNVFLGQGSVANPTTWPARGVKGVFAFLNSEV